MLLVWTPNGERMCLPEEVPALAGAVATARMRGIRADLVNAEWRLRWFGGILGLAVAWQWLRGASMAAAGKSAPLLSDRAFSGLREILSSNAVGVALLMFVVFAFVPWYQARKARAETLRRESGGTDDWIPVLRFETWLQSQAAPVTAMLLGLLAAVWLVQWWCDGSIFNARFSVERAGLDKVKYASHAWWLLLTGPLLHGGVVHFLMNAAAMRYLGRRMETLARWPHLPLVFLFAACVGGAVSASWVATTSVGASGGIMGWLGFLIVFETLHHRLVPRTARKRLVAGVVLTGLIGLLGYRFIDNAAHLGGLVAGMTYALIVFPKSASAARPGITLSDRIAACAALLVLVGAAALAIALMLAKSP